MREQNSEIWRINFIWGVFLLLTVSACSSTPTHKNGQHKNEAYYEPEVVRLKGKLSFETFPGPPEYASIKDGDKPESFWILNLDPPITISAKGGNDKDGTYPLEASVRRLQLIFDYDKVFPKNFDLKKDKIVRVTGSLFHSSTIHHRTDVLVWLQNVEPEK